MKYEIRSNVEKGILKRNRNLLVDAIQSFEGQQVVITIAKAKKSRSNSQNRFYWGVCLPIIQHGFKEATGEFRTAENLHYNILLPLFAPINEVVNKDTGESVTEKLSSSEMTTTQFCEFILEIQKWSAEFLGVTIPDPNSEIHLNFDND
jgi:hypothetical protein